jgi:hypothetical protein
MMMECMPTHSLHGPIILGGIGVMVQPVGGDTVLIMDSVLLGLMVGMAIGMATMVVGILHIIMAMAGVV